MTTLTSTAAVPSQRSRPKRPSWRGLPHFTGDVAGIAAALRKEASVRTDGDCVRAVMYVEAIQENEHLTAAAKARLTAAVIAAVQRVRGWDAPLAVEDAAVAGLPADPDPRPVAAEQTVVAETGERVEVGADGCGCPITAEIRPNGSSIDGTERVEHRPRCGNHLILTDAGAALEAVARGDAAAVAWRLGRARLARPEGDCVEAIALIEAVCDDQQDLSPAARNQRVMVVLEAVWTVREWSR